MQTRQRLQDDDRPIGQGWWKRLDPVLRWALIVYLVARVLVSVWAAAAASLAPVEVPDLDHAVYETAHRVYSHSGPVPDLLLGVWFRWDTDWYTRVALLGYRPGDGSAAFAPLYPVLIRCVGSLLGGEYLLAALLVSNVALVAMLTLLYKLVSLDFSAGVARRTVVYLLAFPSGFFLLAGYTESLFLLFVILALYAARRSNWVLAGGAACLASLTRQQGWVLALPLAYEAFHQAGRRPLHAWPGLLAATGGPIGTALYSVYLASVGLPGFFAAQNFWTVQFILPWTNVAMAVNSLIVGQSNFHDVVNTLALFLSLVLILVSLWKLRPTYWLYTIVSQFIFLSACWQDERLHSMVRYALMLFPNMIVLALITRRRWVSGLVLFLFILLQVVLLGIFARWGWVA